MSIHQRGCRRKFDQNQSAVKTRSDAVSRFQHSEPSGSLSGETINRGPPCLYACKKVTCARSRSCSPSQSSEDYGNIKISQHALTVSVFMMLKLDTARKKRKKQSKVVSK